MKTKALIIGVISSSLLFSCTYETPPPHKKHENHHEHKDDHDENDEQKVSLNHGEKWKANKETTEGVDAMKQLVSEFQAEDAAKDYSQLHDMLHKEFNLIFERCTMDGEAHQQLHNFLMPIHDLLAKIKEEDADAVSDLNDHLATYGDYFE